MTMDRYEESLSVTAPRWKSHDVALRDRVSGRSFVPQYGAGMTVTMDYEAYSARL